jgi:hypothetical protein
MSTYGQSMVALALVLFAPVSRMIPACGQSASYSVITLNLSQQCCCKSTADGEIYAEGEWIYCVLSVAIGIFNARVREVQIADRC